MITRLIFRQGNMSQTEVHHYSLLDTMRDVTYQEQEAGREAARGLLRAQLGGILQEEIGLALSLDRYQIKIIDGEIKLIDPRYPGSGNDLVAVSERGARFYAGNAIGERFVRETRQLQLLSTWVKERLQGKGPSAVLIMRPPSAVYAMGWSYSNIYEIEFDEKKQPWLIEKKYYSDLSLEKQATWLKSLGYQTDGTEEKVMAVLAALPAEITGLAMEEQFSYLLRDIVAELNTDQQQALQRLAVRQHLVGLATTFLEEVFALERATLRLFGQGGERSRRSLNARLNVAFEWVLHAFITGENIHPQKLATEYRRHLLPAVPIHAWIGRRLSDDELSYLLFEEEFAAIRTTPTNESVTKQRDVAMAAVARFQPGVLSQAFSQAQCAVGAVGGVNSISPEMARGAMFDQRALVRAIGAERAQQWHAGTCRVCGQKGLVGECGICLTCETALNRKEAAQKAKNEAQNPEEDERNQAQRLIGIVGADELLTAFLSPNRVFNPLAIPSGENSALAA